MLGTGSSTTASPSSIRLTISSTTVLDCMRPIFLIFALLSAYPIQHANPGLFHHQLSALLPK